MKIAIKGHESRGKEVIRILESLGGVNRRHLDGDAILYYYIDYYDDKTIHCHNDIYVKYCKKYTLEEFEKEFPFKIGDRVISATTNFIGTITKLKECGYYYVKHDSGNLICVSRQYLKLYKEMKEERNITLTLDKAKEWYKKGGELKEIALQAFSEKELTKVELPKTWEEFCDNYPVKESEAMIGCDARIINCTGIEGRRSYKFKDILPSQKSAEAHLAMMQLEQLRDCWRQGWKPTTDDTGYLIVHYPNGYTITNFSFIGFLSFPTREMAKEFLECFKDLIEQAGDLI